MIQKQDREYVSLPQQNKLTRTILATILYFLLGAATCIGFFALLIAILLD